MLQLAQFEFDLKALFRKLIQEKDNSWNADKKECDFYLEETAAFFAGERNVGRQHVDQSYANWFSDI